MTRPFRTDRPALWLSALVLILVVILAWPRNRPASRQPETDAGRTDLIRIGGPEEPVREITPDHQVARVGHKDAKGLIPLEYVETAEGRVTIRRTFSLDGKLLNEEAFLGEKPVPIPKK